MQKLILFTQKNTSQGKGNDIIAKKREENLCLSFFNRANIHNPNIKLGRQC
jgi:hypothetical protein